MEKNDIYKKSKFYIFKITLVASVGGFLFGFDLVIIAGALSFLEADFQLSPAMKGFAVSSAILGAITGPLFGLWFTDKIGRRKTMMLAAIFFYDFYNRKCIGFRHMGFCLMAISWRRGNWPRHDVVTHLYRGTVASIHAWQPGEC